MDCPEALVESSNRLVDRINFSGDPKRRNQLAQKLLVLFKNGFNESVCQLFDPKFFIEKGFSIGEALLITKSEGNFHPTREEIQKLTKDPLTNCLKLEYIKPNLEKILNYRYILVFGPKQTGKTTVIFNLINTLYNVRRDSLYRVKRNPNQSNEYYDEYVIQISATDCYVFTDFRGIGDISLDYLGLDLSGKNNLFTTILKYAQNKQITSILYVNSSYRDCLEQNNYYCLQRLFEILPKTLENRIIFVFTFCTDNQPFINVYAVFESVPGKMRDIIRRANPFTEEQKFWFGINNAFLYEKIDYRKQKEFKNNNKIDIQAVIDGQQYLDIDIPKIEGKQFEEDFGYFQASDQDYFQEFFEDSDELYSKICYQNMMDVAKQILKKIDSNDSSDMPDQSWFQKILSFEENIQELLQINIQLNRFQSKKLTSHKEKSNYLQFEEKAKISQIGEQNQNLQKYSSEASLFCTFCNSICHEKCSLTNRFDFLTNSKICRKLIDNRVKPYGDLDIQSKQIQCKTCLKRNQNCTFAQHVFFDQILLDQAANIWKINLREHQNFQHEYFVRKQEKKILRLQQSTVFGLRCQFMKQIQKIINEQLELFVQNDRQTRIDLKVREKLINKIYESFDPINRKDYDVQEKLLNLKSVYSSLNNLKKNQVFKSNDVFLQDSQQIKPFDFKQFSNEMKQLDEGDMNKDRYFAQQNFNNNMKRFYEQNKK